MLADVILQRQSFDVLHDQIRPGSTGIGEIAVAQPNDVGVLQLFQRRRLREQRGHVAVEFVGQQGLDDDAPLRDAVFAQESDAKAAGIEDAALARTWSVGTVQSPRFEVGGAFQLGEGVVPAPLLQSRLVGVVKWAAARVVRSGTVAAAA